MNKMGNKKERATVHWKTVNELPWFERVEGLTDHKKFPCIVKVQHFLTFEEILGSEKGELGSLEEWVEKVWLG